MHKRVPGHCEEKCRVGLGKKDHALDEKSYENPNHDLKQGILSYSFSLGGTRSTLSERSTFSVVVMTLFAPAVPTPSELAGAMEPLDPESSM